MTIVTDHEWRNVLGEVRQGFYMQNFLRLNLDGIPSYLSKAWDVVGIVSGHGKVRIGKSTCAIQIGYYISWILAGGRMLEDAHGKVTGIKAPDKPVRFGLDNVVFSPAQLIDKAQKLYAMYGKNQVIIYDEGRAGLDSAAAMTNINKGMQDFFQECGVYGHVILIVLPNFFKLHEDYAVSRSLFLVDVFADRKFRRGYYNFFNEQQKEWLYYWGKKKIGAINKYASARPSFWGRFSSFLPFDKDDYEEEKMKAIRDKKVNRKVEERTTRQWIFGSLASALLLKEMNLSWNRFQILMKKYAGHTFEEHQAWQAIEPIIHDHPFEKIYADFKSNAKPKDVIFSKRMWEAKDSRTKEALAEKRLAEIEDLSNTNT